MKSAQIDLLPLALRADVRPGSVDAEARTAEVIFSTGAPVMRYDFFSDTCYVETLSMKTSDIRLDRLNDGAPFLNTHSAYDLGDILGVVVSGSARVAGGKGIATIRFSKRDTVEPVWQDIRDGIIRNVSVGYRVHKYEQTEPSEGKPAVRHAVDWEPYEISAVPMPADNGAKVRAEPAQTNPCVVITRASKETTMDDETVTAPADLTLPNPSDPGAPRQAPAPVERAEPTDNERLLAIQGERLRVEKIIRAVRNGGLPSSVADGYIREGISVEEAATRVLDKLAELGRNGPVERPGDPRGTGLMVGPGSRMEVDEGPVRHVRAGITNALLHRVNQQAFPLDDLGRLYAGSTLMDLAKYCLQANNIRTTGMSRMEIAGLALGLNSTGAWGMTRTGYHSISDYPNILADVANKTLRASYNESPQTFGPITRRVEVADFKNVNRVQLGEAPALEEVLENGEFLAGTIGEGKETYRLKTYGKKFNISRQALINDDTDAFSRVPQLFGRSARNRESQLVWVQITSNPLMGDGNALFSTAHANLAGTPAVIDITSLGIGRAAMRNQLALDGAEFVNVTPRYLYVPPSKETVAQQFTTQITPALAGSVNPFSGNLTVIAEPRLEAASATAWYLFGAIADGVDIIELAFLSGENGPVVETQMGFTVDGLEIKCRHDAAAKVIDWRGIFKNAGA